MELLKQALSECKDPEVAKHIQAALDAHQRLWYTYRSINIGSGTDIRSVYLWEIHSVDGVEKNGRSDLRSDQLEKELDKMIQAMVQ